MTAIDGPASETLLALGELIEMDAGSVLVESRGNLVLGLLDRDSVHVVDPIAGFVVAEAMRAARKRCVIGRNVDFRACRAQLCGLDLLRQVGNLLGGGRGRVILLSD